jgi:ADP-ribosylglycohydrolase
MTTIAQRIHGIIYGLAIGDALGKGAEFFAKDKVQQMYPHGLTDYSQIQRQSLWQQGEWTDDTAQMLCILDSLIEKGCVDSLDIARRFRQWAETDGRGIGQLTFKVIFSSEFLADPHSAAKYWWEKSKKASAPNGAVMRTAVIGIWDYLDSARVSRQAETVCRITHADQRCVASCVAVSVAIACILRGQSIPNAIKRAEQFAEVYTPDVKSFLQLAQNGTIADLCLGEVKMIGYTYKAMSAGFWALNHARSFEDGLINIVNEGGDADTNGAVAGALLGAMFGFAAIPHRLVTGLLHEDLLKSRIVKLTDLVLNAQPGLS